jgi:hypothetical protein
VGESARTDRDRCEQAVAGLPMPTPFTVEHLLRELERIRGRRIRLMPLPRATWLLPCGLLVRTADTDVICHTVTITGLHREHVVLHEIGHLLMDDGDDPAEEKLPIDAAAIEQLRATVLPDLSPGLIRRLLTRISYDDSAERRAELFATLAARRIDRHRMCADQWWREGLVSHTIFELATWRDGTRD